MRRTILSLLALLPTLATQAPPESRADSSRWWKPTSEHRIDKVEGFELRLDPRLVAKPLLRDATLKEIGHQLYAITRKVPTAALVKLRQVPIWISWGSRTQCAAYHPSRAWLTKNGFNPDFERCVEIGNPATFLAWTKQQPWMVLHELAHAYQHRYLADGYRNGELASALARGKAAKSYEKIRHVNGRLVRHYALTSAMEFFAEASEAFFGTNDMFPFVRGELKAHDPETHALVKKLWGAR